MFDKIIAYSIKHKFMVAMVVVALIGVGSYSIRTLPIDALPDITNNQVQIITSSPSLATQEVELYITYPIELAVKSIPHIVELRSISRFGLSVITVVFEEDVDVYWARAQITERLRQAEKQIPENFGSPELAPISTGLGEIFQYTVTVQEEFKDQYSVMDLRSFQDWIIIPQLLGTRGVAEVNTLGGILKEYEVAVSPDKLKSMGVTMSEIFSALEANNENTGGAYIDKKPYAYYIRSVGMISSLKDVSNIVVKVNKDIPVLIRDVADVQLGNSIRYGATTRNGQGEVVNGMVMMLKGENSADIVNLVKEKIEKIKTTLPEGIQINPYLDRSKLVSRAITTVKTNLIEGALIVIFILVLLIGNWRAGLIVASVIPLSLLFAVSMMKMFGVSGNLMSLGAIDFGLIVDGAVIIVEAIVHRLQTRSSGTVLTRSEMDKEVYAASSNIRTSAAFGEMIILIVYLPILALVGIEGKMFAPMAQTVSFAILGAFILSLTYVPMMSALVLSKRLNNKRTLSDKIISTIHSYYLPALKVALKIKGLILVVTIALFGFALWLFSTLGGEFIPTLSEGDIATHIIIPPGSSLEQEIATTTKVEKLIIENFPEVEQVVSKIGSAEVPTDPMPMEVADAMVILKDKSEWTSASSKEEMFEKLEHVIDDLPGVTTEFSQPIQMRFNELMTGVRSDVGIKIFGDDIDRLVALGDQAESLIQQIDGVENPRAESVSGLPQINVIYDKEKIALYGLNVKDLNQIINMGFAGASAGTVYEGEKKYNLVVRLSKPFRKDISNLENLYVPLPSGSQIPLSQVADIKLDEGPAQISRENGKRRIIIGFNVRGRDVESVVEEIQDEIESQLELPVGYYVEYAGQFENLKRAKSRLAIAVPIALILIFILLYFTFYSVQQSILIFTAIPLSAIGGVFALYLRDMPFSISAGIGFIALFGVAVLNGIVLIGCFNQLKSEGITDVMERIFKGTAIRLRPVIMTASVASLGFLPMALSTSAGAEVQKPLATVVIGGLITATLLTLIILPILYYYLENGISMKKNIAKSVILLFICTIGFQSNAQITNLDKALDQALKNNQIVQGASLEMKAAEERIKGAYSIPKAELLTSFGQMNTSAFDMNFNISQKFNPFERKASRNLAQSQYSERQASYDLKKEILVFEIRKYWDILSYNLAYFNILKQQIELWKEFEVSEQKRFEVGETNQLAFTTAEVKRKSLEQKLLLYQADIENKKRQLKLLLNTDQNIEPDSMRYQLLESPLLETSTKMHPELTLVSKKQEILRAEAAAFKSQKMPDFTLGYFIQSIKGQQSVDGVTTDYDGTPRFQGVNAGLTIPIFFKAYNAKVDAKETEQMAMEAEYSYKNSQLATSSKSTQNTLEALQSSLDYFEQHALMRAEIIERNAKMARDSGEISYLEYIQAIETKIEIDQSYLNTLHQFNQTVIQLLYLHSK
ncbi:MAG: CusA/CzcA family heavy metal efflux RND transporter [Saprospiraceae bacterium]|nr:CusA/CzcA family heavy metal efflux RND transporter [Saprospiraceae bacterium]